jgi:hypothetical protein
LKEGNGLKKLLTIMVVGMVIAFTTTACGSNDAEMTNSIVQQTEQPTMTENENAAQAASETAGELVRFPENYDKGVLYTTVTRGNTYEELYTSREAIEAVKNRQPIPSGTIITLLIHRDGKLSEYFVMEKRTGWGAQNPPELRNGDWRFQAFTADRVVDRKANIGRCISCHANAQRDDYVYTLNRMKNYDRNTRSGLNDSQTESRLAGIHTGGWEVAASTLGDEDQVEIIQRVILTMHFFRPGA